MWSFDGESFNGSNNEMPLRPRGSTAGHPTWQITVARQARRAGRPEGRGPGPYYAVLTSPGPDSGPRTGAGPPPPATRLGQGPALDYFACMTLTFFSPVIRLTFY